MASDQSNDEEKESASETQQELQDMVIAHQQKRENMIKETEQLGLKLELYANSIYGIDNTAQTFSCSFHFKIHRQLSQCEFEEYARNPDDFQPKLLTWYAPNAVNVERMDAQKFSDGNPYYLMYLSDGTVWVFEKWVCNMTFVATTGLKNFPFDVQLYEMQISFDARDIPNRFKIARGGFIVANTNLIGCDFQTYRHQQLTLQDKRKKMLVKFWACFGVKRDWQFYAVRVIFVLAIISFLSNMCFFFGDIEDTTSDRFGSISTSLLTTVAFIFIISEYLPPLKYLTFLDVYIYSTFGYIFLIAIENVVLTSIEFVAEVENIDYLVAGGNVVIWVLFHILYGIKARGASQKELKKFGKFKRDIDEKTERATIQTGDQSEEKGLSVRKEKYDRFEDYQEIDGVRGARRYLQNKDNTL